MRPLSRSPRPPPLGPHCPLLTEGFPPPISAATASSRPWVALPENGGNAPQDGCAIDRRAEPDSKWSSGMLAPCAEGRGLSRLRGHAPLPANQSGREEAR